MVMLRSSFSRSRSSASWVDRGWLLGGWSRQTILKILVVVPGDTGGCCWFASLRAVLRTKDGGSWVTSSAKVSGSTLTKRGGASSSSWMLETEEARDSLDWLIDPSAN